MNAHFPALRCGARIVWARPTLDPSGRLLGAVGDALGPDPGATWAPVLSWLRLSGPDEWTVVPETSSRLRALLPA
ncbi:MAG: hypothetical protein WCK28_00715 [Burkholderiales bacterium]|jgi:hypothetical protein